MQYRLHHCAHITLTFEQRRRHQKCYVRSETQTHVLTSPAEFWPNLEPASSQTDAVHGILGTEVLDLFTLKNETTADQLGPDFGDRRLKFLVQEKAEPVPTSTLKREASTG